MVLHFVSTYVTLLITSCEYFSAVLKCIIYFSNELWRSNGLSGSIDSLQLSSSRHFQCRIHAHLKLITHIDHSICITLLAQIASVFDTHMQEWLAL